MLPALACLPARCRRPPPSPPPHPTQPAPHHVAPPRRVLHSQLQAAQALALPPQHFAQVQPSQLSLQPAGDAGIHGGAAAAEGGGEAEAEQVGGRAWAFEPCLLRLLGGRTPHATLLPRSVRHTCCTPGLARASPAPTHPPEHDVGVQLQAVVDVAGLYAVVHHFRHARRFHAQKAARRWARRVGRGRAGSAHQPQGGALRRARTASAPLRKAAASLSATHAAAAHHHQFIISPPGVEQRLWRGEALGAHPDRAAVGQREGLCGAGRLPRQPHLLRLRAGPQGARVRW